MPSQQTLECNPKLGGVKVFSADSDAGEMNWSCSCAYPDYATYVEGEGCTLLPNICGGPKNTTGTFTWDATMQRPSEGICKCNKDHDLLFDFQERPICIPTDKDVGGLGLYPCLGKVKGGSLGMFCGN